MGFQQATGKMPLVLVIAMAACINLRSAQANCIQSPWSDYKPRCSWGTMEPYYFTQRGRYSNWCCTDPREVAELKEEGKGCQTTKCITEDWQRQQVTELEIAPTNTVDGVTYYNKEAMRGDCTDEYGIKGEAFVMCPENSVANALISLYGTEINEFPHMVKMFEPTQCGGTVYNSRYVLTAAHCVVPKETGRVRPASSFKLVLGSNLGGMRTGGNVYEVEKVLCHEHYSGLRTSPFYQKGIQYDVALLKLRKPIDFQKNPNIKALRIAPENFNPFDSGTHVTAVGWGTTDLGTVSEHLQKAQLKLRTDEECYDRKWARNDAYEDRDTNDNYRSLKRNKDQLLCIGGYVKGEKGFKTGQGDSGGPSICRDINGEPVHCGITSFSIHKSVECNQHKTDAYCGPSMHARVSHFHNWIVRHAGRQDPSSFMKGVTYYGQDVSKVQYPHQVHIKSSDGTTCGGTLISQDAVVTAAHCVVDDYKKTRQGLQIEDKMRGGVYQPKKGLKGVQIHPGFQKYHVGKLTTIAKHSPYGDNLAVIRLNTKVPISPSQMPKLPAPGQPPKQTGSEVALQLDSNPPTLRRRNFRVLANDDCQNRLDRLRLVNVTASFDTKKTFCGVETYSGGNLCDREEGGALICNENNGRGELCGIQTFRLCSSTLPSAFLNVANQNYLDFITKAMAG